MHAFFFFAFDIIIIHLSIVCISHLKSRGTHNFITVVHNDPIYDNVYYAKK